MGQGGRPRKFDYDSEDFYDEILALAMQGLTDAEIADNLEDRFGQSLSPDTFNEMKNGRYDQWTKEQNEQRGERINRALTRGRRKINAIVRGAYLKAALGGKKLKNVTTTERQIRLPDGTETGMTEVQKSTTETEQGPSIQALSTWLYNHDSEWREKSQQKIDITSGGKSLAPQKVDIEILYNKKEDCDLQLGESKKED